MYPQDEEEEDDDNEINQHRRVSRARQALGVLERSVIRRSMCPDLETKISEDYPLPVEPRPLIRT